MTADRSMTSPPSWAESLLQLVLSRRDCESVSGDLLEEYRTSIVPSRRDGADRWYVRQVAGHILRQAGAWGVLVAAIGIWRYLLDTLAPIHYTPGVVAFRSAVMSWALMAAFASAGAWHAWRTGHLIGGVLLALVAGWIGGALSIAGTALLLVMRHDPATMAAIEGSGGVGELWAIPLIMQPLIGTFCGFLGAVLGHLAAAVYGASRPNTKSA
jgi:hypothetical protein